LAIDGQVEVTRNDENLFTGEATIDSDDVVAPADVAGFVPVRFGSSSFSWYQRGAEPSEILDGTGQIFGNSRQLTLWGSNHYGLDHRALPMSRARIPRSTSPRLWSIGRDAVAQEDARFGRASCCIPAASFSSS
jgi:hypothetical protein